MPQNNLDIMNLLDPLPEKFAVMLPGDPRPRLCPSEEHADAIMTSAPDSEKREIIGYRIRIPDLDFYVEPKNGTNKFILARQILGALQMLSSQIMASVQGEAPVIQVAQPGQQLPQGGKPNLRIVQR